MAKSLVLLLADWLMMPSCHLGLYAAADAVGVSLKYTLLHNDAVGAMAVLHPRRHPARPTHFSRPFLQTPLT